ncbi:toll/interleukin-1 receptor (TIR) domain-containing protein [Artemisia annua]|uniref:Toll/interleukin-1 receptor (TIR) domain-containing protein n=1 Tax=Artemisia annua TaxID=35608 RepID=A0A2U1Q8K9_ARTAN|nr:toll/interleukin-1 receptor (TIR) domain-containing protein [Artemisia annua]
MASSSTRQRAYDVFVSFRSEDIRKTLMDHLFSDLKRKGIRVNSEEDASFDVYEAIEQSRFIIVIFSQNYASSASCLKELVKIYELKESDKDKYEVWPVFYDVSPSMVRNQTGAYKEAILKHEDLNVTDVLKWKKALTWAGNLSGWDLQNTICGHELYFIDTISKEIFYKLIDGPIHVGTNLVGLTARADQMDLTRFEKSEKVHMIGICGIGGLGKTTLAKAIYNLMYKHFEGQSFCEDVKNNVNRHGLVHLQTKLLDDIIKDDDMKNKLSIGERITLMKRMMKGKKVIIVLDDVDHQSQFDALAGDPNWFKNGSMVLVTSRDRQLLKANHVEEIYDVALLNDDEALELFSMYAFKKKHPNDEFIEHVNKILNYVNGLPLALKSFGSFLFNKNLDKWEHELDIFQRSPNAVIQKVLRVSYDGLDASQKNMFLDIVCFFKGEKKDYVGKILENIGVLVDKSLITICEDRIQMHNLIQEMGRKIVLEESEEPGERSRLWAPTDVLDVLKNDKGTDMVKGLALDLSCSEVNICGPSFVKLKNLRLLKLYIGGLSNFRETKCKVSTTSGKLEFLSDELQLLCWHGYPFQHLPTSFDPENLLVLDMSYSCIKQIWSGSKGFNTLTSLNISHCHSLSKTPDFTQTPNLKELILDGCENLIVIHPSITSLKALVLLNLKNCKNLKILPDITPLESLKHLILSGCSKMENLVEIRASWYSFFSLSSFLNKFRRPVLSTLGSLQVLNVSNCNLSRANLSNLGSLRSLVELDMSRNDFTSIDANLNCLSRLTCLRVIGCKNLKVLPKLPFSIVNLEAQGCVSLVELPKLSNEYNGVIAVFDFKNCLKVVENKTIESLLMLFLPQVLSLYTHTHIHVTD